MAVIQTVKRLRRLSGKLVLLQFVIDISSNLCVCEQPNRRQNLFVRWLVNGVIETICSVLDPVVFVRRNTIIELTYRKKFATCC